MKLIQKRLFRSREFEVTETGLIVAERKWTQNWVNEIRFEDLDLTRRIAVKEYMLPFVSAGVVLLTVGPMSIAIGKEFIPVPVWVKIIATLLGPLSIFLSRYFRRDEILYPWNNGYLGFFSYLPSKAETDQFLIELRSRWLTFLTSKYGYDEDLTDEQRIGNLRWLYDRGVITAESYEAAKNAIKGLDAPKNPIGFSANHSQNN